MAPKKATKNSKQNNEKQPQPWRDEAEARLRKNRQHSVEDIKVFEIDISATEEEFEESMEARVNHIRRVATTFVQGYPVTPPNVEGFVTHHAVRLTDREGGGPSVVLLFQEFNVYFTAFQREESVPLEETKESRPLDARGWLAFKDAKMPAFLEFEIIDYTVSYHKNSQDIRLGFGVKEDILHNLLGFTVNREQKSAEGELALHTTPYMFSELLRLGKALEEVVDLIKRKQRGPLTHPLVNQWGNISRVALTYELRQDGSVLKKAAVKYKLNLFSEGSTEDYSISKLVGGDGHLRVLLYSEDEVQALLKKRQKDNPPTTVLALKILIGRGQNFHISEVERQLLEDCSKHGKVIDFLVVDTQKILVKYSHPSVAYESKIHLDGSLVGGHIVDARFSNEISFSLMKESCKGKKVELQQQSITNVALASKLQPAPAVQSFMSVAADEVILQPEYANKIMPSHQFLTNAVVEKDILQASSSNVEPSDNQIPPSDHFRKASFNNVSPGKQSVELEAEEPAPLEELHLLACIVRSVPPTPSEGIAISPSLLRRLGNFLPPPQVEYYNSHQGKLPELLASHQELFVVEGDLIHLRQGAQRRISTQIAVAKVKAAPWSEISIDLTKIAVTPQAPGTQGKASVEENLLLLLRQLGFGDDEQPKLFCSV